MLSGKNDTNTKELLELKALVEKANQACNNKEHLKVIELIDQVIYYLERLKFPLICKLGWIVELSESCMAVNQEKQAMAVSYAATQLVKKHSTEEILSGFSQISRCYYPQYFLVNASGQVITDEQELKETLIIVIDIIKKEADVTDRLNNAIKNKIANLQKSNDTPIIQQEETIEKALRAVDEIKELQASNNTQREINDSLLKCYQDKKKLLESSKQAKEQEFLLSRFTQAVSQSKESVVEECFKHPLLTQQMIVDELSKTIPADMVVLLYLKLFELHYSNLSLFNQKFLFACLDCRGDSAHLLNGFSSLSEKEKENGLKILVPGYVRCLESKNAHRVKELHEIGVTINTVLPSTQESMLMLAIKTSQQTAIRCLLDAKEVQFDGRSKNNESALSYAVRSKNKEFAGEIFNKLIDAKCDFVHYIAQATENEKLYCIILLSARKSGHKIVQLNAISIMQYLSNHVQVESYDGKNIKLNYKTENKSSVIQLADLERYVSKIHQKNTPNCAVVASDILKLGTFVHVQHTPSLVNVSPTSFQNKQEISKKNNTDVSVCDDLLQEIKKVCGRIEIDVEELSQKEKQQHKTEVSKVYSKAVTAYDKKNKINLEKALQGMRDIESTVTLLMKQSESKKSVIVCQKVNEKHVVLKKEEKEIKNTNAIDTMSLSKVSFFKGNRIQIEKKQTEKSNIGMLTPYRKCIDMQHVLANIPTVESLMPQEEKLAEIEYKRTAIIRHYALTNLVTHLSVLIDGGKRIGLPEKEAKNWQWIRDAFAHRAWLVKFGKLDSLVKIANGLCHYDGEMRHLDLMKSERERAGARGVKEYSITHKAFLSLIRQSSFIENIQASIEKEMDGLISSKPNNCSELIKDFIVCIQSISRSMVKEYKRSPNHKTANTTLMNYQLECYALRTLIAWCGEIANHLSKGKERSFAMLCYDSRRVEMHNILGITVHQLVSLCVKAHELDYTAGLESTAIAKQITSKSQTHSSSFGMKK